MCTLHIHVTNNSHCLLSNKMHEEAMSVVCDFDPDQQDIIKSWTDLGDPVSNLARNKSPTNALAF